MAVHVEDHPIEYFDFEGVIPAKQYGAGDVIVWDWGTWEPEAETPDPRAAIEDGELKFVLDGEKLRGRFTIVRTSRRPGSAPATAFEDDSEQWLLIKKRDDDAVAGLGRRGPPAERQDRPHERRGQGRPRRDLDQPGAGGRRRDRPRRGRRRSRCPTVIEPMARDARRRRPSATPTGCSRSSGTAIGSRRSSATARSSSGRGTARTPRRTSRSSCRRRPGSTPRRRSSTARSSRSTRTAGPTSAAPGADQRARVGASGGSPTAAARLPGLRPAPPRRPSLLDVPLEDRKQLLRSVLRETDARPLRGARRRRGRGVPRGGAERRASRASSPSSAARATSPAGGRRPG